MGLKEKIIKDYKEVVELAKVNLNSVYDCRLWSKKLGTIIEIGSSLMGGYDCNEERFDNFDLLDAQWIRIDEYGCLSYIYIYINEADCIDPRFDVYVDDDCIFDHTTIERIEHLIKVYDIEWDIDKILLYTPFPRFEMYVSDEMSDDEISDYLTNRSSYCHKGFKTEIDW